MRLAFSTLACPDWSWSEAIRAARSYGYEGIEWRTIDGQLVTPSLPNDTARAIASAMRSEGLETCALDASVQMALGPGEERQKAVQEVLEMLEVARALDAGFLRVFIGKYPPQTPDATAIRWVADGLAEALPKASALGIGIALEVHSFEGRGKNVNGTSDSTLCRQVVEACASPSLGILWDVGNPYLEEEPLSETWGNVKGHLLYLHVKDQKRLADGAWKYVLNGEGDVDLARMAALLRGQRFTGWLSYEWEKKWHPELADPGVALPHYVSAMRALLK